MIKSFLPQGDLNTGGGESQSERHGDERGAERGESVLDICYGPYEKSSILSLRGKSPGHDPHNPISPLLPLCLVAINDCV